MRGGVVTAHEVYPVLSFTENVLFLAAAGTIIMAMAYAALAIQEGLRRLQARRLNRRIGNA